MADVPEPGGADATLARRSRIMTMKWDEILDWVTLVAVSPYAAVALGEWVRNRLRSRTAGVDLTR